MANTIKVTVDYDPPNPPPNPPPPQSPADADDSIADPSTSALSGTGDATGASTNATEPNQAGGAINRQRRNPVPPGCTFKRATVEVSLDCTQPKKTIRLDATGNVSASARIDGTCIYTTAVSTRVVGRVTETVTVTQKKCCGDKEAAKKQR